MDQARRPRDRVTRERRGIRRAAATSERAGLEPIALLLALLAVLVRLPHLGWGLPDIEEEALPLRKALAMWGWSQGHLRLDPETAGWPSLSFYAHLLLQHLHYWGGRLVGAFADRNDYFVANWLDPGPLLRLSRALGVAAAGAIVWIGARLGHRLAGRAGAVLAGGFLALSPLLVEHSQLVEPDILMALCAALAVSRLVEIQRRGLRADYVWAGVWIGLGISCKYTPLLLLPAVFVAHALRPSPGRRPSLFDPEPWWTLAATAIAFTATSPFVLLRRDLLARDVWSQSLHLTAGHFGQGTATGMLHYLVDVLAPGLGAAGLVLALAGLVFGVVTVRGPWLVLAASLAFYYAGLAVLTTQFDRYMLPLLMPLAVGLAGLVPVLRGRWPRHSGALVVATGMLALGPAAWGAWKYHENKARPSTQALANQYLREVSAREKPRVMAEVLSVSLPTARGADELRGEVLSVLSPAQRARILARPAFDIDYVPMYTVQPEASAFYYDLRHFVAHDLVIVSDAVRGRYLAERARFPVQVRFYGDLEHFGTLVQRFGRAEHARGPEIRVYRISPDSARALIRARGAPALEAACEAAGPLHLPDFLPFVEGVARAALGRGQWSMAEQYYQVLLQRGPQAGMGREQQVALERMLAALRAKAAAKSTGSPEERGR